MQVFIDSQRFTLDNSNQIGAGGEATVFKVKLNGQWMAAKIYHKPTPQRAKKLEVFLTKSFSLDTGKIALPLYVIYSQSGQAIGKTVLGPVMPFFTGGFEEVIKLSNKNHRATYLISSKTVAEIFLDGLESIRSIHQNGLVIGDFNDLNVLFRDFLMLFIDVDSWQFDSFPCPVGTEQFLAPELYNIDLSKRPVFKPEHDWYSYAVMLFKSLLLIHPYGGNHKSIRTLLERAQKRVSVFNRDVPYPKIALSPDLLTDDLAGVFEDYFSKGKRTPFPENILRKYANSLVECSGCKTYYPSNRNQCPICTARTLIIVQKPSIVTKGVTVTEFIRTGGPIVFHKVISTTIFVLAYENGKTVLYTKPEGFGADRTELFDELPGAHYEIFGGNTLVANLPNSNDLLLFDLGNHTIKGILTTQSETFANRRSVFGTSDNYLLRIVKGSLLYGYLQNGRLAEKPLRSVMSEQTWFNVKQHDNLGKPTVCGFFQVLDRQLFWLTWEGRSYDNLAVGELEPGESQVDLSVRFSSTDVVIRRLTQLKGIRYIRTDVVDSNGKVIYSSPMIKEEKHPNPYLHGLAYSGRRILSASDNGILQESLESNGTIKTFDATKHEIAEGNSLLPYEGGLLVVTDDSVKHLVLS